MGFRRDARSDGGHFRFEKVPIERRRGLYAVLERHDRPVQRRVAVAPEPRGQHHAGEPSGSQSLFGHDRYNKLLRLEYIITMV